MMAASLETGETSHLLVNAELGDSEADRSPLYQDKEVKRKLKKSDVINIVVICLDSVCQGMSFALISSFYPITAQTKGLSIADVGIIMASLVFGLVFGYLLPKIGTRKILLGSMFFEAASLFPFSFVMEAPAGAAFYAVSLLCRGAQGVALAASQVSCFSFAAGEFNDRLSTVMGLLEMSAGFGVSSGAAVGGFLYNEYGFKVPFYFLGSLSLFFFVITYICVHPSYSFTESTTDGAEQQNSDTFELNIRTIFKVPAMFLPLLVCMNVFANFTFFDVALAPFLHGQFKVSPGIIGLAFLFAAGLYAILAPAVGHIVDKKGHGDTVMVVGCFIATVSFIMLGPTPFLHLGHNIWITLSALGVISFSEAFMYVPSMGLCFQVAADHNVEDNEKTRGFISSIFVTTGNLGNLVGPLLGGVLINAVGFEYTGLIYGSASFITGLSSAAYLFKRHRKINRKD